LPESQIFTYQQGAGKGSFAGFANFFRYQLLLQTGGWWVDTDLICLKPFDFQTEYVFASEWTTDIPASSMATNSVIKAPQASDFAQYCWQACQAQDIGQLAWGVTGPALAQQAIADLQLQAYVQPPDLFCPILYTHILDLIDPHKNPESILESSYAIHLWNEMWRRHGIDKNQSFDSHCLYEQLKSRYQIGQSSGLPRESSK
jgi:mannosyltransferase OCH1-like enzyme